MQSTTLHVLADPPGERVSLCHQKTTTRARTQVRELVFKAKARRSHRSQHMYYFLSSFFFRSEYILFTKEASVICKPKVPLPRESLCHSSIVPSAEDLGPGVWGGGGADVYQPTPSEADRAHAGPDAGCLKCDARVYPDKIYILKKRKSYSSRQHR